MKSMEMRGENGTAIIKIPATIWAYAKYISKCDAAGTAALDYEAWKTAVMR